MSVTRNREGRCSGSIHRYRRMQENENGKVQWKCMDCPSSTYRISDLIGNTARCYICKRNFKLSSEALTYAKVKCSDSEAECNARVVEAYDALAISSGKTGRETQRELLRSVYGDQGLSEEEMQRKIVSDALGRSDSEQDATFTYDKED